MRLRVLYIEDEGLTAQSNMDLAREHYGQAIEIVHAANYAEAVIARAQLLPFHIEATDFGFAGIDPVGESGGVDHYRLSISEDSLKPYYFLSGKGHADINDILRRERLPAVGKEFCLQKPLQTLVDVIEAAADYFPDIAVILENWQPMPPGTAAQESAPSVSAGANSRLAL